MVRKWSGPPAPSVSLTALEELRNIHGPEVLKKRLLSEGAPRTTLSFYRYVDLPDPAALRDALYAEWEPMGVLGRIYLAKEGINAQLSLPSDRLDLFRTCLDAREPFAQVPFKIAVEDDGLSFLKLTIKVRPKLVADGLPDTAFDTTNVGEHLTAEAFNARMDAGVTVVDMRNRYESMIGHFEDAVLPKADTFRDLLPEVLEILAGKEEEPVLLYCTGGIRCEKASAWLRHHGFSQVGQLHGGIIDYARQVNATGAENKYRGQNFVFDRRLAERISDDVVGECQQCGTANDRVTNCGNAACNVLLVQCPDCAATYDNCCTPRCAAIMALPADAQRELRKGRPARSTVEKAISDTAGLRARIAEELALQASGETLIPELTSITSALTKSA